ncbi:MAG: hypothetical protein WBA88_26190 [Pseudaminobacter sp.]
MISHHIVQTFVHGRKFRAVHQNDMVEMLQDAANAIEATARLGKRFVRASWMRLDAPKIYQDRELEKVEIATVGAKRHEIYSPIERESSCLGFARYRDRGARLNLLSGAHRYHLLTAWRREQRNDVAISREGGLDILGGTP